LHLLAILLHVRYCTRMTLIKRFLIYIFRCYASFFLFSFTWMAFAASIYLFFMSTPFISWTFWGGVVMFYVFLVIRTIYLSIFPGGFLNVV